MQALDLSRLLTLGLSLVFWCGLGALLIGLGYWRWRRNETQDSGFMRAPGVVIAVEQVRHELVDGESGTVWHSRVRYQPANGEVVQFLNGLGGVPALHRVGQAVTVLYDPAQPEGAKVATPLLHTLLPLVLLIIGGSLIACGCCSALAYLIAPLSLIE